MYIILIVYNFNSVPSHSYIAFTKYSLAQVITFLDLRGQELEGTGGALRKELDRLQALYDLQTSRQSATEARLTAELLDCRVRLEETEMSSKSQKVTLCHGRLTLYNYL